MNLIKQYKNKIPLEDIKGLLQVKPLKTIRTNTLITTRENLMNQLQQKGFQLAENHLNNQAITVIKEPFSIGATTEYLAGHYIIQDASSMNAVIELNPKPGETILDMTAGPGTKTTHISELMKNEGVIIACDKEKKRLKSVMYNAERMHCENIIGLRIKAQEIIKTEIKFDKILLDAPCSAEGTLHKNPEVLNKENNYKELIKEQQSLIEAAVKSLKKEGTLVYSTCAINPDENEGIINHAINQGMKLENLSINQGKEGINQPKTRRYYPHVTGTQGFFIARMVKQ